MSYFKSPLSYCGNKFKLLPQILPLLPKNINTFVDLFCGGLDVSINVDAKRIISNDVLFPLIDLYECLKSKSNTEIYEHINNIMDNGFCMNKESYNELRDLYNEKKNPLDLLCLIRSSFSLLVRFNSKKQFNATFGYPITMKKVKNIIPFADIIRNKNITFSKMSFVDVDFSFNDYPQVVK